MPKFSVVRPSVAVAAATALVAATAVVLLVSSVSAPPAGAAIAPGSTVLASVHDGSNARANDFSQQSVISADGGSIAFVNSGQLDNLDPGRTQNVYVRDLVRNRTVMISRGQFKPDTGTTIFEAPPSSGGGSPVRLGGDKLLSLNGPRLTAQPTTPFETSPDDSSEDPSISANGRYVAFATDATNIVHKDNDEADGFGNNDIIVCDRDPDGNGVYDENFPGTTVRNYRYFLVDSLGNQDDIRRSLPKLSADASRIVWEEEYFGEGRTTQHVFTASLLGEDGKSIGSPPATAVQEVPTGAEDIRSFDVLTPAISGDGNHVAVSVPRGGCDGECPGMATISVDLRNFKDVTRVDFEGANPIGNSDLVAERNPAINFDGTVIAFEEETFESDDGIRQNNVPNIYVVHVDYAKALAQRVTRTTIASRNNAFDTVNGAQPALSADGRYVAFVTDAILTHDGVDRPTVQNSCLTPSDLQVSGSKPLRLNALPPARKDPLRTFCQIVVRDLTIDQDRLVSEQTSLPGTLVSPGLSRDCSRTLASDATCAGQNDSVNPSVSGDGSKVGFDSFADDLVPKDPNNSQVTQRVFVRTLQPTLQGNTVDFGPVELPQSIVRTAQINELGNGPLPIQTVTLAGANAADFTIIGQTCQGITLHATGGCGVSVQFGPAATGNRAGQLLVTVRGGRTFTVNLIGSGTAKPVPRGPEFLADPSPMEFGQRLPLSTSPDVVLNITNPGDQPLTITAVAPVGPGAPGDFSIPNNACAGVNLPANGTCKITVRFSPTAPGDRSAVLQFTDNAPGGPQLVAVHGLSNAPTLEVSPGITPPSRVVTVIGKGFAANKKVNITFLGQVGSTTVTAGADGTFRTSLLIFPKAKAEQRTVVGAVDGFPAITANVPLLIVFSTVSPADFVIRG